MKGLAAVDLGVTTNEYVELNELSLDMIMSLLLGTNQGNKRFLITEKGKLVGAIVPPVDAQDMENRSGKLDERSLVSLLDQYEEELDRMI